MKHEINTDVAAAGAAASAAASRETTSSKTRGASFHVVKPVAFHVSSLFLIFEF